MNSYICVFFFVRKYHNLLICFDASQCRRDKEDAGKSVGKFTKHILSLRLKRKIKTI